MYEQTLRVAAAAGYILGSLTPPLALTILQYYFEPRDLVG
jgi:hypothetical protein